MDIETQKILEKNPTKIIFDLNEENDKKIFELYHIKKKFNIYYYFSFFSFVSYTLFFNKK